MSNKVTKICRPLLLPAATQKCVLMALADRADDNGAAWPSIPWLCMWTGFKRTAVIEAVKSLAQAGIVVVRKKVGSNNSFDIDLEKVEALALNHVDTSPADGLVEQDPCIPDPSVSRTGPNDEPVRLPDSHQSVCRTPTSPAPGQTSPSGGPYTLKTPIKTPSKQKRERVKQSSFDPNLINVPSWLPIDIWAMWNRHRVAKKKNQTEDSVKLQLRTLGELIASGHDPRLVIEQSIEQGWTGLFAGKNGSTLATKITTLDSQGNVLPACPVQTIVDLYHEVLPEIPEVVLMQPQRSEAIARMWSWVLTSTKSDGTRRAQTGGEAENWFRSYFERARMSDYLMGREQRSSSWRCDLDFLLTDKGMAQVIEKTQERVRETFV